MSDPVRTESLFFYHDLPKVRALYIAAETSPEDEKTISWSKGGADIFPKVAVLDSKPQQVPSSCGSGKSGAWSPGRCAGGFPLKPDPSQKWPKRVVWLVSPNENRITPQKTNTYTHTTITSTNKQPTHHETSSPVGSPGFRTKILGQPGAIGTLPVG